MSGKIDGDQIIDEDLSIHGMIVGNATVRPGRTVIMHGMICGDLIAEVGSIAVVHGMVNGTMVNHGAEVEIFGMVDEVANAPDAFTRIDPSAVVRGRRGER